VNEAVTGLRKHAHASTGVSRDFDTGRACGSVVRKRQGRPRRARSMGRYPFLIRLKAYLKEIEPYRAASTLANEGRTLRRIHTALGGLHQVGKVSTTDPGKLGEHDLGAFVMWMRSEGFDVNTQVKYLQFLRNLTMWSGNPLMGSLRVRKQLPKANYMKELTCLTEDEVATIIQVARTLDGWQGEVMGFIIPAHYYTGLRPSELRKAHLEDLDTKTWLLKVRHPKGEGSWGNKRTVPIPPPLRTVTIDYLDARERKLRELGVAGNPNLIPNLSKKKVTEEPYSGNAILKMKREVEARSGVRFELRKLRNTCGQHLKDRGVPIEAISKLLGHATTQTTERHYARMRDSHAFRLVENAWGQNPMASIQPDRKNPLIEN